MRDLSAAIFSGTVCWMIQLVPQIWKSWREKSTEGLSPFIGYVVIFLSFSAYLALTSDLDLQAPMGDFRSVSWGLCDSPRLECTSHCTTTSPIDSLFDILVASEISSLMLTIQP